MKQTLREDAHAAQVVIAASQLRGQREHSRANAL